MKNIQIEQIVIWAKNPNLEPKILTFAKGKINIIYGLSQTGKSAIIPIIDYCLGSTQNKIPVGHIRDCSAWFGIVLNIDETKMLIARENSDEASNKIIVLENIEKIPILVDRSGEMDIKDFKLYLNKIMGVPFYEPTHSMGIRDSRLSFRDLVTFNFQPQYIVANPNCLLYKMDTTQYKRLMLPVFNLVIGAETLENIENRIKLDTLREKLNKLNKRKEETKRAKNIQLEKCESIISNAIKYGLLDETYSDKIRNPKVYKNILKKLSEKTIRDLSPSIKNADSISDLLNDINKEIEPLNNKLISLQSQKEYIEELIKLLKERNEKAKTKINRLEIANFIHDFCEENADETACLCDLEELCSNLNVLTNNLNNKLEPEIALYVKKLLDIDKEINNISMNIKILKNEKIEIAKIGEKKNIVEKIYEDIIIKSKILLEFTNSKDEDINEQIKDLQKQINEINIDDVETEYDNCIKNIIKYGQKYLPDIKEFHYISQFIKEDMTIKVKKEEYTHKDFYLWETGSGSNWVAFHIGVILGFHFHFIEKNLPILNFIMYDQPSQVYFPQKILKKEDEKFEDKDVEQVKKMFKTFQDAVKDANGNLQIIVSDHADESVWGDIPEEYKHIVANWSNGDALIPQEWLS